MGLLDVMDDPTFRLGMGLLGAGSARSDGAGVGQRLNEVLGGMDQWQQQQAQKKRAALQEQMFNAQLQEMTQKTARERQLLEQEQRKRAGFGEVFKTGLPPLMGDPSTGILPSAGTGPSIDVARGVQLGYTLPEIAELAKMKNINLEKVARTQEVEGPNGEKLIQQLDEVGRPVGQPMKGYTQAQLVSLGDRSVFAKPTAGASFNMGQSPDSKASNALGWANNAVSQANANLAERRFSFEQGGGGEGGATQANFIKQFGKPSAGYRWKADGSQEFIPGGPADQKAQSVKVGEGTVAGVVADLRDKYTQLDKENGIVSTRNRFGTNLGAYLGSTGIGQTLNGAVGTNTQSARDSIAMTRPLLLQSIMKATGMSAKQMDSNAELKMYLATATDPTKGLEANLEALDRIESLYGGGRESYVPTTKPVTNSSGWKMEKVGN